MQSQRLDAGFWVEKAVFKKHAARVRIQIFLYNQREFPTGRDGG